VEEEFAKD